MCVCVCWQGGIRMLTYLWVHQGVGGTTHCAFDHFTGSFLRKCDLLRAFSHTETERTRWPGSARWWEIRVKSQWEYKVYFLRVLHIVDVSKQNDNTENINNTHETPLDILWRTKSSFRSWVRDFFHSSEQILCRSSGREREWGFTNHCNKDCRLQGYPTEWPLNRPQRRGGGGLGKKGLKEGRRERERWVERLCVHTSLRPPVLHCQRAVIHGGWRRREWLHQRAERTWQGLECPRRDERSLICLARLQQPKKHVYESCSEGIINVIHRPSCGMRRRRTRLSSSCSNRKKLLWRRNVSLIKK